MDFKVNSPEEYLNVYSKSIENPKQFWNDIAEHYLWKKKWKNVFVDGMHNAKNTWYTEAELNITENCLDRHLEKKGDKIALIWEANSIDTPSKTYTYKELHEEVCRFSNILKNNNIKKGDRICLYMPMIPELTFAVLACARIGAIHSVVFAGFSAQALADRINDATAKMVITADGSFRGSKTIPLKTVVDEALVSCPSVKTVLLAKNTNEKVTISPIDKWIHEEAKNTSTSFVAETMNSEDELFILYTSGSTGKPKGVVHSCAGYMVYAGYSFANVFQYEDQDVYWCTADIGWITGHSYIIYGPLLNGATTIMFEGVPTFPNPGRFWEVVDKWKVNQFYTAPTAIRALMACGDEFVDKYDLSSLKVFRDGRRANKRRSLALVQ